MYTEDHPDGAQIERLLRGETSRAENRALVRHLLRGCPRCQKTVRKTSYPTEPARARRGDPALGLGYSISR